MAYYKVGTSSGGGVLPTGNAVAENVLKDKTFSNASGINKVGTMPDNSTTTSNGTVPGINSSYPNVPIRLGDNLQMGVNTDGVKQLGLEPPQGYYPGGGLSYIGVNADELGDAVAGDVAAGKTFTSESGIAVVGTRENSGTFTASSRNAALDMGNPNTYRYVNTTGVPNSNTETYTASSRGASLDMGATNNYRYVNTNGVPNSNSGTYTFASGDTGGTKDLGETNTYRYVNATNVYNKGKADGGVELNSSVYNFFAVNESGTITSVLYHFSDGVRKASSKSNTFATSLTNGSLTITVNSSNNASLNKTCKIINTRTGSVTTGTSFAAGNVSALLIVQ